MKTNTNDASSDLLDRVATQLLQPGSGWKPAQGTRDAAAQRINGRTLARELRRRRSI